MEVAQKSRSPAALLSLGHKGTALPGMLRAPKTPWAMGQCGEGAKGLLAEPGSLLLVERDLSAFGEPEGCLRRTLCLAERAGGDLFIVTGTEAADLGLVPASAVCSPLRGRSSFTPSSLGQQPAKLQRGLPRALGSFAGGCKWAVWGLQPAVLPRPGPSTTFGRLPTRLLTPSPSLSLPGLSSNPGSHGDLTKYWSRHFVY